LSYCASARKTKSIDVGDWADPLACHFVALRLASGDGSYVGRIGSYHRRAVRADFCTGNEALFDPICVRLFLIRIKFQEVHKL
jgi:hypothetical protein